MGNQTSYAKRPPASALAIVESGEAQGLQGVIDATLRVAEARAQKRRRMREAILADDVKTTLSMACELAGFSERDVAKRVERLLSLAVKISA